MQKSIYSVELEGITKFKSGKVREVFELDDKLLVVASDRISAFDCVFPDPIPQKGMVLNQMAAWWFERTGHIVQNHVMATQVEDYPEALTPHGDLIRGRSMLVRKAEPIDVECVVRGYLIGSGWKEYVASGSVCGLPLRAHYQMADRLDEPIFTPAHKAVSGHDENISFDVVVSRLGEELAAKVRDISLALYRFAYDQAIERGIIIADTKFEFGLVDGELVLIDEIFTPDSSRFWPESTYAPGQSPPSFDKQYVRDYLEGLDWDKNPPAPTLPEQVILKTREKYLEAFRLLTGHLPDNVD